jgi:NDP-sugar pyrophosphorylase family protein
MKTILLLAGQATRMRPLSSYLNKGMIPVNGRPLLEWVITKLARQGLTDLIVAVTMFPEQLQRYFGDGSRFGVRMTYALRPEPSQTAGEVHALRDHLADDGHFVVHYGDILTNLDLPAMMRQHLDTGATATLGLVRGVRAHMGVAEVDESGRVSRFTEKPAVPWPVHAAVNVFSRKVLDYCGSDRDFGSDVIPAMLAADEDVRGFVDEQAYWLDVGRLSDLDEANALMATWES